MMHTQEDKTWRRAALAAAVIAPNIDNLALKPIRRLLAKRKADEATCYLFCAIVAAERRAALKIASLTHEAITSEVLPVGMATIGGIADSSATTQSSTASTTTTTTTEGVITQTTTSTAAPAIPSYDIPFSSKAEPTLEDIKDAMEKMIDQLTRRLFVTHVPLLIHNGTPPQESSFSDFLFNGTQQKEERRSGRRGQTVNEQKANIVRFYENFAGGFSGATRATARKRAQYNPNYDDARKDGEVETAAAATATAGDGHNREVKGMDGLLEIWEEAGGRLTHAESLSYEFYALVERMIEFISAKQTFLSFIANWSNDDVVEVAEADRSIFQRVVDAAYAVVTLGGGDFSRKRLAPSITKSCVEEMRSAIKKKKSFSSVLADVTFDEITLPGLPSLFTSWQRYSGGLTAVEALNLQFTVMTIWMRQYMIHKRTFTDFTRKWSSADLAKSSDGKQRIFGPRITPTCIEVETWQRLGGSLTKKERQDIELNVDYLELATSR
eukprot:jgi/Bigna1/89692/estExt_fgenesh1_pg.C_530127